MTSLYWNHPLLTSSVHQNDLIKCSLLLNQISPWEKIYVHESFDLQGKPLRTHSYDWSNGKTTYHFNASGACLQAEGTRIKLGYHYVQSGTKPNLVAKVWLPTLVSSLWYMKCFKKYVQCGSNNDVRKYCGCGIPHNWDMSFGNFGGLPTLVAFQNFNLQGRNQLIVLSMITNKFTEVPHTIGCIKFHKTYYVKGDFNRMEPFAIGGQYKSFKFVYFGRVGYFNW